MKTPVNTVFISKMKTARNGFEDRSRKTKKRGEARRIRLSSVVKTIIKTSMLCTMLGEHIVHIDGANERSALTRITSDFADSQA